MANFTKICHGLLYLLFYCQIEDLGSKKEYIKKERIKGKRSKIQHYLIEGIVEINARSTRLTKSIPSLCQDQEQLLDDYNPSKHSVYFRL